LEWAEYWGAVQEVSDRNGGTYRLPGRPLQFSREKLEPPGDPAFQGVLSRNGLEFDGAVSGRMRIRGQAARSIGLAASFWFRVCHPSTLRMVI
jgi:hypothetical protein